MAKKTAAAMSKTREPEKQAGDITAITDEERQDSVIQQKLEAVNDLISPYRLAWVDPVRDCVLLERNARYMTKEQLGRLTDNLKSDGFLSQLPFCIREQAEDGTFKYKVISGNHRVKGAIKASLRRILVLFGTPDVFDEQRQLAIQLAHNAISGQDDMAILQELYSELKELGLKAYTGIDEKELMKYKALDLSGIGEQDIALNPVTFMFSDGNKILFEGVLDKLEDKLDPEKDALVVGDIDRFIEIMTRVKARLNIRNRSVAVLAMCRICEAFLEAQDESTLSTKEG